MLSTQVFTGQFGGPEDCADVIVIAIKCCLDLDIVPVKRKVTLCVDCRL